MVRAALIAGLSAVALAVGLDAAGGKGKGFGTPPYKCGHDAIGQSGCYGSDVGPNVMDDAGNGNINISPHLVEVGEYLSMTVVGDSTPNWVPAAGLKPRRCKAGAMTCVFKAVSATGGWQRYQMGFGLGAREQDYYGVTGKDRLESIEGTLSKADRSPIKNAAVKISGPTTKTVKTDSTGSFRAEVKPGAYTVAPAPKVCRLPLGQQGCERTARVVVGPGASVNFRSPSTYKLSGTVYTAECSACGTQRAPLEGAKVAAVPRTDGGAGSEAVTKADGTYELELATDSYDVKVAEPTGGVPAQRNVSLGGDTDKVDFEVCPGGTQTRAIGECTFIISMAVVDLAGNPVAGATVWGFKQGVNGVTSKKTDASGAATLEVPPGKWWFHLYNDLEAVQPDRVYASTSFPAAVTLCEGGTAGPQFGSGRESPYSTGCNIELVGGSETLRRVHLELGLFPVIVDLSSPARSGYLEIYDPQPADGHGLPRDHFRLPLGENGNRRHYRLLLPSYADMRQQNAMIDLRIFTNGRERVVHASKCTPKQSVREPPCWLRLRKGGAATGRVTFKP